jgi:hypothetical protein
LVSDDWFRAFYTIVTFNQRHRRRIDLNVGQFREVELRVHRLSPTDSATLIRGDAFDLIEAEELALHSLAMKRQARQMPTLPDETLANETNIDRLTRRWDQRIHHILHLNQSPSFSAARKKSVADKQRIATLRGWRYIEQPVLSTTALESVIADVQTQFGETVSTVRCQPNQRIELPGGTIIHPVPGEKMPSLMMRNIQVSYGPKKENKVADVVTKLLQIP